MARKGGREKSRTVCLRIENSGETSEWRRRITCKCEVMKEDIEEQTDYHISDLP